MPMIIVMMLMGIVMMVINADSDEDGDGDNNNDANGGTNADSLSQLYVYECPPAAPTLTVNHQHSCRFPNP